MSDRRRYGENTTEMVPESLESVETGQAIQPKFEELQANMNEVATLVDDIVLKKYLYKLTDMNVVPLDENLKNIAAIRFFKITEMVYQNNEYSTYKFASVFNAVQGLNCGSVYYRGQRWEEDRFLYGDSCV